MSVSEVCVWMNMRAVCASGECGEVWSVHRGC